MRVRGALQARRGTEVGSFLRLIDSCITHLKDQGPSRTCNESKEEEEDLAGECVCAGHARHVDALPDARTCHAVRCESGPLRAVHL